MARIYDKYRDIELDNIPPKQAQLMAKYKPGRYVLPSEVEDVEEKVSDVLDKAGKYIGEEILPDIHESGTMIIKGSSTANVGGVITNTTLKIYNSEIDATRGAIQLADENGIDLNELYSGKRIIKQDVQNFINEQD